MHFFALWGGTKPSTLAFLKCPASTVGAPLGGHGVPLKTLCAPPGGVHCTDHAGSGLREPALFLAEYPNFVIANFQAKQTLEGGRSARAPRLFDARA